MLPLRRHRHLAAPVTPLKHDLPLSNSVSSRRIALSEFSAGIVTIKNLPLDAVTRRPAERRGYLRWLNRD